MLLSWWKALHEEDEKPATVNEETDYKEEAEKATGSADEEEEIDKHINELQASL